MQRWCEGAASSALLGDHEEGQGGELQDHEVALDTPDTPGNIQKLFSNEEVVTVHSEEASLEDIFIKITGRGLTE